MENIVATIMSVEEVCWSFILARLKMLVPSKPISCVFVTIFDDSTVIVSLEYLSEGMGNKTHRCEEEINSKSGGRNQFQVQPRDVLGSSETHPKYMA